MIHLSLNRFFFSPTDHWIFQTIQTSRLPIFTGTCMPRPYLFSNFLLYFCRCPCFPDACPCFLFICLLTCVLCLPGMSHPSQSSGSFSALQTTEFCPTFFNFITLFKLLHLLLVAQQYLIAMCHSLLAIGASLGSALHPGKFTVA